MSFQLLELAESTLGGIAADVVFIGGASITLWITDPGAPPPRPTKDVDVIVEIATHARYYAFEDRLRSVGFRNDGELICRWHHPASGLVLDAMPTDAALLGFANGWGSKAFPHAVEASLPNGRRIRAIPPAFPVATKLEAFQGRGNGDLRGSRDFTDIVALVDGREELIAEINAAPANLREYVRERLLTLLTDPALIDGVRAQMLPDEASQRRAEEVVLVRLGAIAGRE